MSIYLSPWKVGPTTYPYPAGYGVYRENLLTKRKYVIQPGISECEAGNLARELNEAERLRSKRRKV